MGLTRKRDLRSGKAVWTAYRHANIPASRLERSTHTEVVVVGAGITGALVSQVLTEVGIRPLILDRRDGARLGSTAASTALLQFELDNPSANTIRTRVFSHSTNCQLRATHSPSQETLPCNVRRARAVA